MAPVTLHHILPLVALVLNVGLVAIALVRDPSSRLNRVFVWFVSAMALWNFGVFMLRRTMDESGAFAWEVVIHVGIIALPAFYYHFVVVFLEATLKRRRALITVYGLSAAFSLLNLTGASAFMRGVQSTAWGWAPVPGPLYHAFLVYFYVFLLAGLVHLRRAHTEAGSGFRRNRILLVLLGTAFTVLGGFVDIIRFAVARVVPVIEHAYPVGIPTNMLCAVLFGAAIVRYRMFDVSVMVKKCAVYGMVGAVVTSALIAVTWGLERAFALERITALWIITPLGFLFTLLLTPLSRPVEEWIERLMFSKPRGCHKALVALSKQMSMILDFGQVVETLVRGLVRGIPLTHCALLVYDATTSAFVLHREETTSGEGVGVQAIASGSPLVGWLEQEEQVLVKEAAIQDRTVARRLGTDEGELERINASLIVPVKIERTISGILLLGEKLSGEIFDAEELELLSVLATQTAISMENARLYEAADRGRRRIDVLYQLSRRLATVGETDETLSLIVTETRRLLGGELAAIRLLEGEDLVLRAWTESPIASALRARLHVGESLSGAVVATNQPVIVEDVLEDTRYDPAHRRAAEATGIHGFLGVPLRANDRATGVLYLYTRERRRFRADEVSLLAAFADQASVSLEKGRMAAEQKRAEEALRQSEKLATMGNLLAGVAHELNNPLTVIVGYAELLRERVRHLVSTAPAKVEAAAEQIDVAAHHCSRIVRNFLALARKHPPERQRVALNQIVADTVDLLAYPFRTDSVTVTLDLAADLPDLWADQHQLKQVVVNLLTNAHHAMRQTGMRRLTLMTRHDPAHGRVRLSVADTGPGIPPAIQARIFEPFFTTKPVGEGTGLGLSLCHGIVESHGGAITVESEPGHGATFIIELPAGSPEPVEAGSEDGLAPSVPGQTVLVVDDDPFVTTFLAQLLAQDGHRVDTAPGAAEALERLGACRYDLVISDVRMPKIDGPRFYRELERRRPGDRPPFIFMTGDILGGDTLQFLESIKAPCLNKPFGIEEVRRAVHAAVAASH